MQYLTTRQIRQETGMSLRLQAYQRRNRLYPFSVVGHRTILVARADLEKFLASRRVKAVGP